MPRGHRASPALSASTDVPAAPDAYHCERGLDRGTGCTMTVSTSTPTPTDQARIDQASGAASAVLVGGLLGLLWAAGLRSWMAQLVGAGSSFSWLTFVLVLLPGAVVGALLGRAAHGRAQRTRTARRLALAPVLFASALLDPQIFAAFIHTGEGGGALMVVLTALSGGFVLGRRRWSLGRVLAVLPAACGLLLLTLIGTMAAPVTSPRGAWVCLFGLTFMLVLCAAAALPYPPPTQSSTSRHTVRYVALGGVVGLAWACALRGFMAEVAGTESGVDWMGTFVFILLPGLLVGGLLGWAAHLRATGDPRYRKRLALSPLLFSAVLFSDPSDPLAILEDGVGAGALAVPLIAIAGGYAVCGRGRVMPRAVAGAVALSSVPIWALTAPSVGGPGFALGTPHGLWAAVLYLGLLAALALGASIPLRHAVGETRVVRAPAGRRGQRALSPS